jgi:thioredoxin-related protein
MKQAFSKIEKHSRLAILAILMVTSAASFGQKKSTLVAEHSITFIEGESNSAFRKASQKGGYIFVDLQAKWCGPCKLLKAKVFTEKKVAAYFNSHFVNLSIDVEQGEGPELAKKWHVEGLPTLLIVDAKGNIIKKSVGYMDAESLLAFASEAVSRK